MEFITVILIILLIVLLALIARIAFEITHPQVSYHSIKTDKLAENEKVRITFISDLHSRKYGKDNIRLIKMVSKTRPDFIVLGGDMITASFFINLDKRTVDLISALTNIAPVFYAPGNHEKELSESEKHSERYEDYMFEMECMDVTYLDDKEAILTEDMYIRGLDIDSRFYVKIGDRPNLTAGYIKHKLGEPDRSKFNILIAHTPEFFDSYVSSGYDLVLCGHFHGGMIDLPWVGPLVTPEFRFRPAHAAGAYRKSNTIVIVSRGAGGHFINIRLFNRPEINVIDIRQSVVKKAPRRVETTKNSD